MLKNEGWFKRIGKNWRLAAKSASLRLGLSREYQVFTGLGGDGGGFSQERHAGVGVKVVENPNGVADNFPLGAEVDVFIRNKGASEEGGGGEDGEGVDLGVPGARDCNHAGAEVVAIWIDDKGVSKEHFGGGMVFEEFGDCGEGVGEVLFVGVEVGVEIARCTGEAAVYGVIHSGIGLGANLQDSVALFTGCLGFKDKLPVSVELGTEFASEVFDALRSSVLDDVLHR